MLLAPLLRQVLLYGGLVIGAGAIQWLRMRWHPAQRPTNLPGAKVVSDRRLVSRFVRRWAPVIVLVLSIGVTVWAYRHSYDYYIVTDGPRVSHRLGDDRNTSTPLAPGVEPLGSSPADPAWVINESSQPVRVETVPYRHDLAFENKPQRIPAGMAAYFSHIDHIGPANPPPSEAQDSDKLGMEFRYWLTWDP